MPTIPPNDDPFAGIDNSRDEWNQPLSQTAAPTSAYMAEAELQDRFLRDRLTVIRRQQEAGDLTVREAADLRITAMEHHLAATRALRVEHFGKE